MIKMISIAIVALMLSTSMVLAATEFIGPPNSLTAIHQLEYRIGIMAGANRLCGYLKNDTLITKVMKPSKYFKAGRDRV